MLLRSCFCTVFHNAVQKPQHLKSIDDNHKVVWWMGGGTVNNHKMGFFLCVYILLLLLFVLFVFLLSFLGVRGWWVGDCT